ncbi:ABC transporter substrate-binding protein [Bradyrhizobium sp. 33ap4]|uniref:ABC transporter substrate-binding protein n=1 Tax=Bradyrhizobium sp. 33ap4 TaxID=3061630 RepID=UPI00292D1ED6|nr:ABC transporter substrate-binding protein [Bradyrhizobium sp. 33ap4]
MTKPLMIASALAVIGLVAVTLASTKPAFADDQLTVVSTGGAWQANLRKAVLEPFSKATGIKVIEDEFNGELAKIRAMVQSKTVSWDVFDIDTGMATQLCTEGVLETIDWNKLGLDRSKFIGADSYECGVPFIVTAAVIAYDKDKLPNGPKSIADLFDTEKFPGKRGLPKTTLRAVFEWALIADGVPTKDVYKVLNTPEGVDRAFKKLDTIKKDVVWWQSNSQALQLLADGQVVMTYAPSNRVYDAVKNSGKHFGIVWDAQQRGSGIWAIPKGSPHLDAAYKFLAFAGSPRVQADLTQQVALGPTNKDAIALVDPAMLPHLPTAPDNAGNVLVYDAVFWAEKGDELRQRFTTWLAK